MNWGWEREKDGCLEGKINGFEELHVSYMIVEGIDKEEKVLFEILHGDISGAVGSF